MCYLSSLGRGWSKGKNKPYRGLSVAFTQAMHFEKE